ncbi:hypothetical protein ROP_pROB01-03690 (plasmid) [Rhodococcus opacus B4]|uniref:Uncharacterized protein n=1 Tax=Rhodococcus opacus (strain B4) TaxID=632772 RepID=C1BDC4_RHOOB|nr:hypothetical protein ROP_pROB01-03690 [Rhodococcus opacus B4]
MERTYAVERAAHARMVATEKGRRVGRPSVVTDAQFAYATELRERARHHRRDHRQDRADPLDPVAASATPAGGYNCGMLWEISVNSATDPRLPSLPTPHPAPPGNEA